LESLNDVFLKRKLIFCDDLVHREGSLHFAENNLKKRFELSNANKFVYYTAKAEMLLGGYPPLEIKHSSTSGFYVSATDNIKKNTFICEYSGEVITSNQADEIDSDSLMILQKKMNKSRELVIHPDKIANIAKFISGINNNTMKKHQNVKSFLCSIDQFPHIILHASKNIKKGDPLYYDYNEGNKSNPYNTSDFNEHCDETDSVLVYASDCENDNKIEEEKHIVLSKVVNQLKKTNKEEIKLRDNTIDIQKALSNTLNDCFYRKKIIK
jgi:hypothetical protein